MNNTPKRDSMPPQMPPMRPGGGPGGRPGGPMGARLHAEKPKHTKETLFRLLKYIGKSKLLVIALIVIMAVVTVSDLAGPALQGAAIDTIRVVDGRVTVDMGAMTGYLIAMAVLFAVSASMAFLQGILAAKLSQNTVYTLRNDLFKKISKYPRVILLSI